MGAKADGKALQPERQRKTRPQVGALCYRTRKGGVEFLLVQTRGGRWIFPKGGLEPGLTQAQSAALEAFEEAGVHGRIEQISFTRYSRKPNPSESHSKKKNQSTLRNTLPEVPVFLCEVTRLESPQEANRNPTWFTGEKAKQRLAAHRNSYFGGELAAVIDRAMTRIARLRKQAEHYQSHGRRDALQETLLEGANFSHYRRVAGTFLNRESGHRVSTAIDRGPQDRSLTKRVVLQLGPGAGAFADASDKVTAIDSRRPAKRISDKKPK